MTTTTILQCYRLCQLLLWDQNLVSQAQLCLRPSQISMVTANKWKDRSFKPSWTCDVSVFECSVQMSALTIVELQCWGYSFPCRDNNPGILQFHPLNQVQTNLSALLFSITAFSVIWHCMCFLPCHPIEYGNDISNKLSYFVRSLFIIDARPKKEKAKYNKLLSHCINLELHYLVRCFLGFVLPTQATLAALLFYIYKK